MSLFDRRISLAGFHFTPALQGSGLTWNSTPTRPRSPRQCSRALILVRIDHCRTWHRQAAHRGALQSGACQIQGRNDTREAASLHRRSSITKQEAAGIERGHLRELLHGSEYDRVSTRSERVIAFNDALIFLKPAQRVVLLVGIASSPDEEREPASRTWWRI
jgi:hypothetical protein